MICRLFAVILFALAVSTATPAHATTLSVDGVDCWFEGTPTTWNAFYACQAYVSGGTGSYVSYTWDIRSSRTPYTYTTPASSIHRSCYRGYLSQPETLRVIVTVTDSAGATATRSGLSFICDGFD